MKLLAPAILAAVLVVSACDGGTNQATIDGDERQSSQDDASAAVAAMLDEPFERTLELNPLRATFIGDHRFNDGLENPAQALAHKIGQLKIREIRDDAERRLGNRFDVKEFHTEILKDGPMPLSMLAAKRDRWVESQL